MRIFGRTRDALDLAAAFPAAGTPVPPPAALPVNVGSPWSDPTALDVVTWAGLLDAMDDLPVSRAQSMAIPAVSRGRDLIAISIARLALYAMNAQGRLTNQPNIVAQPEVGRPRFVTLMWTVDDLIFHGVAWWVVVERYATDNRPRSVRWCPHTEITLDDAGNPTAAWGKPVNPMDVIRFDGPHEGFLRRGHATVRNARRLAARYADAVEMPTPDVELHQVGGDALTAEERTELIAQWAAARRGKNGRVAFTNQAVEARFHGTQPEALLESARNGAALDCARHLGLPAWAVDAQTSGSSLTYSNVPSRARELIDYTLAGYIEAITGRLSLDDVLAHGIWASINTDPLTDGDFATRMAAYKSGVDAGFGIDQFARREAGVPVEGDIT